MYARWIYSFSLSVFELIDEIEKKTARQYTSTLKHYMATIETDWITRKCALREENTTPNSKNTKLRQINERNFRNYWRGNIHKWKWIESQAKIYNASCELQNKEIKWDKRQEYTIQYDNTNIHSTQTVIWRFQIAEKSESTQQNARFVNRFVFY